MQKIPNSEFVRVIAPVTNQTMRIAHGLLSMSYTTCTYVTSSVTHARNSRLRINVLGYTLFTCNARGECALYWLLLSHEVYCRDIMEYIPQGELEQMVRLIGYTGLFAAVFAETGLFFMFFLPGSSMLFTAGLLASHGFFNVWLLAPLITIAAILGDNAGYWFGSQVGHALYKREDSRFFRKSYLEKTRAFYEKHGVRAIVFARLVPIVRTFAPILAGIAEMRYRTFFIYNVVGGVLWGAGVTFAGYFLGEIFPQIDRYITPIIIAIIIASFIPLIIEWYKSRTKVGDNAKNVQM